MFERFTEEARQVVVRAQEEARLLNHNYIGTEHILLGLLRDEAERPDGERPLESLGIGLEPVREHVRRIVGRGEDPSPGQIPFTPRAKKVLELALREALTLNHNWIGPEHILLGISRENEGVASRVLLDLDADAEKIRNEVIRTIGGPRPAPVAGAVRPHLQRASVDAAWLGGLPEVLDRLAREIRQELGRDPDVGDLLLALASAGDTTAGEALREIGIDVDALWGILERIRRERTEERKALMRAITDVRLKKDDAIEGKQFEQAAELRDQERELTERARASVAVGEEALREIRRRLGLPTSEK